MWGGGAEKLLFVLAVCETPHNTINDTDIMLRVNDMYTHVRTCPSIDLHDKDVAYGGILTRKHLILYKPAFW